MRAVQLPHRHRIEPNEEHHGRRLALFQNLDVDEVGESQVGAGLEAFAELFLHLVSERPPGRSDAELLIRRHDPKILDRVEIFECEVLNCCRPSADATRLPLAESGGRRPTQNSKL